MALLYFHLHWTKTCLNVYLCSDGTEIEAATQRYHIATPLTDLLHTSVQLSQLFAAHTVPFT